ncbi:PilZ domain-containing protein [Borrelia miyamotoi]|uniref:PilZ domain-containing protein n=1 Tax=Borrelia miyamotoi TaxID=47466 RepID=A0AAX3JLC3_9SPIR|nr:PilZN3 domain-containing protein [Borrelia miyamotoi]QFP41644.1 PilZ domain-containing protein [Borrelia miyamotoi]QFP47764.1 PilZN3 domain-containing protein [Borrelia miyamotoi]QGT55524.1 PilZ domain-containing protein [Borrelia miyamotoi]QGT56306.1 PilZ domain-containing protein [Borrelia miyamotoi]WAZ71553.1 PilZ domain-containing protein [Borrelia miyamotoi]
MFLSKKIKNYETKYKGKEINMSTEINSFLNIKNAVEMRVGTYLAYGVIYSISMNAIKLILQEDEVLPILAKNGNSGNIHFKSFDNVGDGSLFIPSLIVKLVNTSSYFVQDKEYNLLTLDFISPVPGEFAIKIGKLLDLKLGQNQRIHERIIINKDSLRKLNLISDKAFIEINGTKHKCLIKDISYGGALLISCFDYEGMDESNTDLILNFDIAGKEVSILGKARNLSVIQTPNGKVLALGIAFCEDKIPLDYTMLIHDYFN